MRSWLIGSFTAAVLAFGTTAAQALPLTFVPTADGDVQTFGGNNVDTNDTILAFTQSGGLIRNVILEFDLSSIPDGSTINSARLDFTLTRFVSGANAAVDIFAYNGDGIVDIADFNAPGTQVVDTTTASGGVAGDVRSFAFTSLLPISNALIGDRLTLRVETDSFASINIAALENGNLDPAQLVIDVDAVSAVPLPAALPLALTGLGLLGVLGWKRRLG